MFSGTQIGPKFEHLMSAGISRVEILRGPQGLMYGADAGGVVNVSTAVPESGLGGQVSAEGGRYGTRELSGFLGGANDIGDFALSVSDSETDGFNARTTDAILRDDDGYENTTVHGKVGWNVTEDFRVGLVAHDVSAENEFDGCYDASIGASIHDCSNDYDMESLARRCGLQSWRLQSPVVLQQCTDRSHIFYPPIRRPSWRMASWRKSATWAVLRPVPEFGLVYGVDLRTDSMDSNSTSAERDQDGYFAEYQGAFSDKLFITAGVRYDDNEDFGSHTSYRVSGAYLFDVSGRRVEAAQHLRHRLSGAEPVRTRLQCTAGELSRPPRKSA